MTNSANEYQGHPSWEHWNAALWVSNDEELYNLALEMSRAEFCDYFITNEDTSQYWMTPDGCGMNTIVSGYAWDLVNES